MTAVTIYTTPICPYCTNAKQLLSNKGVEYTEFSMYDMKPDERAALSVKTGGYRTVPQIFIGEEFVGGFDQLNALNNEGKLDGMLGK